MRKMLAVAAIAALTSTVPAFAGPGASSPTLTHDNPSSCQGAARGARNSNTGDREHGGMAPLLTDWIHYLNSTTDQNWGQYNVWWQSQCANPPGSEGSGGSDGE